MLFVVVFLHLKKSINGTHFSIVVLYDCLDSDKTIQIVHFLMKLIIL